MGEQTISLQARGWFDVRRRINDVEVESKAGGFDVLALRVTGARAHRGTLTVRVLFRYATDRDSSWLFLQNR